MSARGPSLRPPAAALVVGLTFGCVGLVGEDADRAAADEGARPGDRAGRGGTPEDVGSGPAPPAPAVPRPAESAPGACAPAPARLWKLTPVQIERTVAALLPGVSTPAAGLRDSLATGDGFSNAAHWRDMSEPHVAQLLTLAGTLASQAAGRGAALAPCLAQRPVTAACVRQVVTGFGARAFRRPLEPDEVQELARFFEAEAAVHGPDVGFLQVLRALFLSPAFLYRSELGPSGAAAGRVTLTAYERAAALSYLVTDGPPDAELAEAAARDALGSPAQLEAQARRLLASPASAAGLRQMLDEMLRVTQILERPKDPKIFPRWSPAVAADMVAETRAFVEHVLWREDARVGTLLGARYSFLNERLAAVYGVPGVAGDRLRQVMLPPGRAGVLTHGTFLAAEATMTDTDPVRRGLRVVRDWLCQTIPEPPPEAGALPPAGEARLTHRERLARHVMDPRCAGCHALIDPAGLALESFDAVGRHRTTEHGRPIDGSGVLRAPAGEMPFANASELAAALARSPDVLDCVATRVFTYGLGREPGPGDGCVLRALREGLRHAQGDLRQLVLGLITSEAFVTRVR